MAYQGCWFGGNCSSRKIFPRGACTNCSYNGGNDYKQKHELRDNRLPLKKDFVDNRNRQDTVPEASTGWSGIAHDADVFTSDLKVVDKVNVYIPPSILYLCNGLQQKFPGLEFSILVKGKWTEDGFELSEETAIPKQEVTGGSVDLDDAQTDKYKQEGFNTIIHSHPFKSASFSWSDLKTLTPHYTCSILYSQGEFPVATISVEAQPGVGIKLTIGTTLYMLDYISDLPQNIGDLIKAKFGTGFETHYNPRPLVGATPIAETTGTTVAAGIGYDPNQSKCKICVDYNCTDCPEFKKWDDEESFQSGINPEKKEVSNQMDFRDYG